MPFPEFQPQQVRTRHRAWVIALITLTGGGCAASRSRTAAPEFVPIREVKLRQGPLICQASTFSWDQAFAVAGSQSAAKQPEVQTATYQDKLVAPTQNTPRGSLAQQPAANQAKSPMRIAAPPTLTAPNAGQPSLVESAPADLIPADPITATASSDASPAAIHRVDELVQIAVANHPSIAAARQRVAAEMNRIPQARALPDPMFNNTFWPLHDQALQTAGGRIAHQMSLSQAVPWPQKLQAKAAIASDEVQVAQAELQRIETEVAESVRLAYYELWYASRALQIVGENQSLVADLVNVAKARYRSGGAQRDVLRAQLESDRLADQIVGLERQLELAQADLATLIQHPVDGTIQPSESLDLVDVPAQLDQLIAAAEQSNPELNGLAWEMQRNRQQQRLACLQQYPDLQVGINWALVDDDRDVISPVANGHDNLSFTVGTSLPIWREKIDAGVREAAHRSSNTALRYQAQRDQLRGRLRRLVAQAEALQQQREIYQQRLIPRTENALKLTVADYRGKQSDFFDVVETYRELLVFETQLARIDANLAGTLAQIERAVGGS